MLDRSIPFKHIIMRIPVKDILRLCTAPPILPDGYTVREYQDGDAVHWADIEAAVEEFESFDKAYSYFNTIFLPQMETLHTRCLFILSPDKIPVATASVWFADTESEHQAQLHWVAVSPKYQGLGLGYAVAALATILLHELDPNEPGWLHTQSWSHKAVKIYHLLGYRMQRNIEMISSVNDNMLPIRYQNDFSEAMALLEQKLPADIFQSIQSQAE